MNIEEVKIEKAANKFAINQLFKHDSSKYNIACNSFILGAKSNTAKDFHTKGLYTEKEVKRLCSKATLINFDPNNLLEQFEKWFNKHKKK